LRPEPGLAGDLFESRVNLAVVGVCLCHFASVFWRSGSGEADGGLAGGSNRGEGANTGGSKERCSEDTAFFRFEGFDRAAVDLGLDLPRGRE
jgi:hypothetical protein